MSLPSSVLPGGPSTSQAHTTTALPARPTSHVPAHLEVSSSLSYIVQLLISTTASNQPPCQLRRWPPIRCTYEVNRIHHIFTCIFSPFAIPFEFCRTHPLVGGSDCR